MMKKAFTMIELVLVIVIVGILAAIMWPRNFSAKAYEAANQILTHIRYTQHLALNNDKFDPSDKDWYKKFWKISFNKLDPISGKCDNISGWRYAVYQNNGSDKTQPNSKEEVAPNPAEPGKYLSGCYSGLYLNTAQNMNIGEKYKVDDMKFENITQGIVFDDLGRPYKSGKINEAYGETLDKVGRIIISAKDGSKASILIFPKTGFACIENGEDCKETLSTLSTSTK